MTAIALAQSPSGDLPSGIKHEISKKWLQNIEGLSRRSEFLLGNMSPERRGHTA